ncbi:MAG: terminase family protein, partial [Acidobacteria bacterium]|nr:terminase family protein [Acidobacteriota bacterium]
MTKKPVNSAAVELAARELARRSLLHYILRFNPDYLPGWFHEDLCRRLEQFLEDVKAGKEPRQMLWVPPRHGKSRTVSEEFPSWALGNYPDMEFIACSYGITLPLDFSRKVRARVREEEYQNIFQDTRIDPEHQNVEGWTTTEGGGYRPAGVGGGITGKGADILLIDDPFKDSEEADSETVRRGVWNWWGSTAYTRLSPKSGVLIIQTRWHDDDLSGRLLDQMRAAMREVEEVCTIMKAEGRSEADIAEYRRSEEETIDKWDVISYPAIATNDEYLAPDGLVVNKPAPGTRKLRAKGEALHPARYSLAKLKKKKRSMQPRHWSALFQQNPVPDEGEFFTKSMIHYAP